MTDKKDDPVYHIRSVATEDAGQCRRVTLDRAACRVVAARIAELERRKHEALQAANAERDRGNKQKRRADALERALREVRGMAQHYQITRPHPVRWEQVQAVCDRALAQQEPDQPTTPRDRLTGILSDMGASPDRAGGLLAEIERRVADQPAEMTIGEVGQEFDLRCGACNGEGVVLNADGPSECRVECDMCAGLGYHAEPNDQPADAGEPSCCARTREEGLAEAFERAAQDCRGKAADFHALGDDRAARSFVGLADLYEGFVKRARRTDGDTP